MSSDELSRKLRNKLDAAESKRQEALEAVKAKAASRSVRLAQAKERLAKKKVHQQERLNATLHAAEANRISYLEARIATAARRLHRVKLTEEEASSVRRAGLKGKMERAAQAHSVSEHARTLLHHRSIRCIQKQWLRFLNENLTTKALALGFIETGVPFSVDVSPPLIGPAPLESPQPLTPPPSLCSPNVAIPLRQSSFSAPRGSPIVQHGAMSTTPTLPSLAPRSPDSQMNSHKMKSDDPFDQLAAAITSGKTLKSAQRLLQRIQMRLEIQALGSDSTIDTLLTRLQPKDAKASITTSSQPHSLLQRPRYTKQERYPPRVFLCAYMIVAHPEVVFNASGEREVALSHVSREMVMAFESMLMHLSEPLTKEKEDTVSMDMEMHDSPVERGASATLLQAFDVAWASYVEQFVAWKSADAAGLESELIKVAIELETSMLSKVNPNLGTARSATSRLRSPEDIGALVDGVTRDLKLIEERVVRLCGPQGKARLHAALNAARMQQAAVTMQQSSSGGDVSLTSSSTPSSTSTTSSSSFSFEQQREHNDRGSMTPPMSCATPDGKGIVPSTPEKQDPLSTSSKASPSLHRDSETQVSEGNVMLMWQLLHDPHWRLPTAEAEIMWQDALGLSSPMDCEASQNSVEIQQRIRRIAETAFWDSVKEKLLLGSASDIGAQAAEILAEMGASLVEVVSSTNIVEDIQNHLDLEKVKEGLKPIAGQPSLIGVNATYLYDMLEWSAKLLRDLGSPEREKDAFKAHIEVRRQLGEVTTGEQAAEGIVKALRILAAQLKLLRLDVANARLAILSATLLKGDGGVAFVQGKLQATFPSPQSCSVEELDAALPHTRGWLALSASQLPHVEQFLAPYSAPAVQCTSPSPSKSDIPRSMKSGLKAALLPPSYKMVDTSQVHLTLSMPVAVKSWKGLFRIGLVSLVSGDSAVNRIAIPEVLRMDVARIRDAQDEFQRVLVLTVCILVLTQSSAQCAIQVDLVRAKERLRAVMMDPNMTLSCLADELCSLSGNCRSEVVFVDSLRRMLAKDGGAFKALTQGVTHALMAWLLTPESLAASIAVDALRRCGATCLEKEIEALARSLVAVAAVVENITGIWLQPVCTNLF